MEQAAWPGAAECAFCLFNVDEDRDATSVVGLAIQRRTHLPRRSLEQPHPEPRFEMFDSVGRTRGRQAEILSRADEAAALHDPRKHPHGVDAVHYSFFPDSDRIFSLIIAAVDSAILRRV
jgi:hypothetical protein